MTPQHAAYVLAQQSAIKALRAQIKKSGGNPSLIPASRLASLARDHVEAHPELVVAALEMARELFPPQPKKGDPDTLRVPKQRRTVREPLKHKHYFREGQQYMEQ